MLSGVNRGGHAEKNNEELIIAMSGSFDITVDDGIEVYTFTLNRSYYGLYIPKGFWREIKNFSTNAIALEFGSIPYDEKDYIRDYEEFLAYAKSEHNTSYISTGAKKEAIVTKTKNIMSSTALCLSLISTIVIAKGILQL